MNTLDETDIKCGLFVGLSSNSKMYSKAIVSFAFLAMAIAGKSIFSIYIYPEVILRLKFQYQNVEAIIVCKL